MSGCKPEEVGVVLPRPILLVSGVDKCSLVRALSC